MSELRIPISSKQHGLVGRLITEQAAVNRQLETACNTILASLENEPAQAQLVGVDAKDGVYALVLTVPDEEKKEAAP